MTFEMFDGLTAIKGKELGMETQNLDIYGHEPIPWSRPESRVRARRHCNYTLCSIVYS